MNLARLKGHENIMSYDNYYVHTILQPNNINLHQIEITMEFADKTLSTLIKESKNEQIPQKVLLAILKQITNGLVFAHKMKCVHLDLKPENILFVGSICKIADWGGSIILTKDDKNPTKSQELCYTKGYISPELKENLTFENENIDYYRCDVYSFAIMTLRCCGIRYVEIKKILNDEKKDQEGKKKDHDDEVKKLLKKEMDKYDLGFCRLIRKMCRFNPKRRPNMEEIDKLLLDIE